jgi:hypothetical protein
MVNSVSLPLQARDLRNRKRRDAFVDDTMQLQAGASGVAPPYLEYKYGGDDVLPMNLAMLRRCAAVAAGQLPITFIQVTAAQLRQGLVSRLAPSYAATGVTRVFLRLRDLDAERVDAHEFSRLLEAVDAFNEVGLELVPDCVGRLGPPLVAGGAASFSSGPVHFRKVPATLLNRLGSGGSAVRVFYEVAGEFRVVAREDRHRVARCFISDCPADREDATLDDLRLHNMHVLREESRLAATRGPAWYGARLIASGQPYAVVWGNVLHERFQRTA